MNTVDKLKRIIAKNPELKDIILSLEKEENKKRLVRIVDTLPNKVILVGKDSDQLARYYQLANIIKHGFIHTTNVTTLELLDAYTNKEDSRFDSLSQVVDDLVLIYDSRAFIPNKQKTNMVMQVLEQNEHCIYYYRGSHKSFLAEHQSLLEYLKDNGIPKINTDTNKQVYEKDSLKEIPLKNQYEEV